MIERHGEAAIRTAEYCAWRNMRRRCMTRTVPRWLKCYVDRGITVCQRWDSFPNFLADMGRRPSSAHSLDRINNNGDYKPSNCRWATWDVQVKNRRRPQPRPKRPPYLWLRSARPNGRAARVYIIDGGRQISVGHADLERAKHALTHYTIQLGEGRRRRSSVNEPVPHLTPERKRGVHRMPHQKVFVMLKSRSRRDQSRNTAATERGPAA
jgi:hypothetical protein